MEKRGQVTIFIIIAVVIVVLAVLIYLFYPRIVGSFTETQSPSNFISECIEEEIENNVDVLSAQGGSISPKHYLMYNSEKIEYLCYTEEYYKTCIMQQPMLKNHIEEEIENNIKRKAQECFDSLEKNYKSKGYSVDLKRGELNVELLPKRIVTTFNSTLTLTKGNTERYNSFRIVLNNNLYELVSITNSILNWEARYGDSETTTYMNYYHDLKVEKKKQTDGSTVYMLTDLNNGKKFQFASRSVAWPPGYGV